MASSNNNTAGSNADKKEESIPAAQDCPLHPGPNKGACEACMEDLKVELATTRDLLVRAVANEERKDKELLIASQKLSRFMKDAKKTRTDLDDRLAKIITEAVDTQNEVNARLDDFTNEVTQKLADIKLCLTEKFAAYATGSAASQQEGAASTSKSAKSTAGPNTCWHHKLLGKESNICSDQHCSMREQSLAAPKRPHPEPEPSTSTPLTKRINVDLQPPPIPPHSVTKREGDESWSTEAQPSGEAGNEDDDEIVYLGKGHASTK